MANKKSLVGILVLVLALVGGGLFFFLRGGEEQAPEEEAADGQSDKQALLERKRAARASGAIDLSPCSATGRVTEADGGAPIAGAVVMLTPKGFESRSLTPGQPADPITATSDEGGGWEVPRVPPGRYTLSAAADGYLPGRLMEVVLRANEANGGLDLALVEGGHLLSGTVTDIGGGPVEGVLVSIVRTDNGNPLSFSRAPAAALTAEDGTYRMTLPDGDYGIGTQHPDYVAAGRLTTIRDGPRVEDFELTPGAVIEGRVVARGSGQGIEDAIVTFTNSRGAFSTAGGGFTVNGFGEGRVHTDAEGNFRLRGLQSGVVMLSAVAEGFATREPLAVPVGVAEQVSGVEVLVDPAFKISGFVVSRQDHEMALEGVLIGAFSLSPTSLFVARGPSESDGYFEVLGVPPGGYNVGAIGEEALPNIFGTGATVVDADVDNVLVEMDMGASVTGRVEPATAAKISLSQDFENMSMGDMLTAMGNQFAQSRSDPEEGTFVLKPISPGKVKLVAAADDGSKGEIEIEVPPEGLENVVISLEPRARVSGRVTDASGKPVAKVQVDLTATGKSANVQINMGGGLQQNQFPTGEDGTYLAKGLDPGTYEVQIKDAKGRTIAWADPADPEHPDEPIGLKVEEGEDQAGVDFVIETRDGVIRGTVLDADGAPLPDAWVTAVRDQNLNEMLRGTRPDKDENVVKARVREKKDDDEGDDDPKGSELPMWFAESPVLTDEAGQFVIEDLKSARYSLVAEGMKGSARARQDDVEVGDVVKLQLERLAGISGKVVQKGKPVTEYSVTLKGPSNRSKTVRNDEGTFLVDRIDPGDYEVVVNASVGSGQAEVTVEESGTADVKIALKGFGKVTGRLIDAQTGEPIVGAAVNVFNRDGGGFDGKAVMSMFTGMGPRTGADGRFEVAEVRPGKNEIVFMDRDAAMSGANIASDSFEIEAEQTKDLGEIRGVPSSKIPPDERGDLGMSTSVAKFSERPLHPDAQDEDDEDDDAGGDETEKLWVLSIVKDGPAAEAGVEPGDEVVSIDGKGVDGLGASAARSMLSPTHVKAGQTISLELEREGSRRSVTVEARSREEDEKKEG